MPKALINHTNHPSEKWDEKQKEGWDKIIDVAFPEIPPEASSVEVAEVVKRKMDVILSHAKELKQENYEVYLMLQGEYTYCYLFIRNLSGEWIDAIAIPTTKRIVEEKPDGTKVSKFEFVKWRFL